MVLTYTLVGIAVIVVLTAISGYFSSSEIAVFSVPSHRIDSLVAADTPGATALSTIREDPHGFLVTVLVSNNVANIAAASVATILLAQYVSAGQAATAATVGTSFFVIVFGEIAPKSYAVTNAERHALRVSRSILVIQRILYPIMFVFQMVTSAINRVTGGSANIETYVTREEIETIVISGAVSGAIDTDESAMIRGVLDLETTTVRNIMIPRTAMITASVDSTPEEVIETCWREHVSRLPLYGETRDDIRGFVDLRDALRASADGTPLSDVMTDPTFVPGIKPVDELLTEMQLDGHQIAMVADEYGTVVGLVTLQDVVEEVVGEIFDRDETDPLRVVDDDTAVANGWATVDYINEQLGLEIRTDGPYETIAGLVNHHTGQLSEEGDRVELGAVVITVLDATAQRVRRVRIDWRATGSDPSMTNQSADS